MMHVIKQLKVNLKESNLEARYTMNLKKCMRIDRTHHQFSWFPDIDEKKRLLDVSLIRTKNQFLFC